MLELLLLQMASALVNLQRVTFAGDASAHRLNVMFSKAVQKRSNKDEVHLKFFKSEYFRSEQQEAQLHTQHVIVLYYYKQTIVKLFVAEIVFNERTIFIQAELMPTTRGQNCHRTLPHICLNLIPCCYVLSLWLAQASTYIVVGHDGASSLSFSSLESSSFGAIFIKSSSTTQPPVSNQLLPS